MAIAEPPTAEYVEDAIGVFDDDEGQARTMGFQLEDVGLAPVIADLDDVPTLDAAIAWILDRQLAGLVCDVQLNNLQGGMEYQGAQLVARLVYEHRLACVLTTGFGADLGMLVRPYRRHIPVLLGREETEEPEALVDGLRRCADEIQNGRGRSRRTSRVPVFIERVGRTEHGLALDGRVGGWSHKTPMRFPAAMLGNASVETQGDELVGEVFFARVNLGADREADLFLEDVEPRLIDPSNLELHFDNTDDSR